MGNGIICPLSVYLDLALPIESDSHHPGLIELGERTPGWSRYGKRASDCMLATPVSNCGKGPDLLVLTGISGKGLRTPKSLKRGRALDNGSNLYASAIFKALIIQGFLRFWGL